MINKSISVSEQVNRLSDFAALLFSWLIPHADDYGVIPGSAKKIKALIVPMRKQSADQVENALNEISNAGLIWRYMYKNDEYIQLCKFDEHQEGLHKRREPKNPLFSPVPDVSGKFREIPGNSRLIEQSRTEQKGIGTEENVPGKSGNASKVQFAEYVSLTNDEFSSLVTLVGEHGAKRCIDILDNYKGSSGKKYRSDYRAIISWVVDRYNEEQKRGKPKKDKDDELRRMVEEYDRRQGADSGQNDVSQLPVGTN